MYQIAILDAIGDKGAVLRSTLESRVKDLRLDPKLDFEFLTLGELGHLRTDSAKVGVLFSDNSEGQQLAPQVERLLDSTAILIPVVDSFDDFASKVPAALKASNGMRLDPGDPGLENVAGLVLELLGLLRKRRRLFISYKRTESSAVAQQLYHALDERSFDVFLDTLSVRAADLFQEQLWHRMADSDVVVLLYTASIHSSGWVEKEIERANGMKITVLQVIWPNVRREPKTSLFEPLYLDEDDFDTNSSGQLSPAKSVEICALVETLRARSLANRQAELIGTLRERAADHKLETTIQPNRCVDVRCNDKERTFTRVFPAVGIPDSETFHADALTPSRGATPKQIVLLYDALNVAPHWKTHLDWLHQYLPVKTVKVFEVDRWLSGLC
jgi:hypothetical protein